MRICTPHCGLAPETTSGGETYERELLTRLGGHDIRLDVILARGKRHPAAAHWTVHRFPIGRGLRWWVAPFIVPGAIKRVWDAGHFDVLRAHSLRYIGPSALWARRRYRLDVPIVAHHHHVDPGPLTGVIEARVARAADRVIVGSEFARRQLAAELGVPGHHVTVVPYGIDEKFAPRPPREDLVARYALHGHRVVLFFGGLKPRKNLPKLLDAWADVARDDADARLVIAGGGPLLDALRQQAARLGIAGSVVFTGYVPEADKADHFNLADVFVFPSAMEGFGLAVGEAMSSGLAVVASDRGSLPELLVDGEGGFLCDPDRPPTVAARLKSLLADAPLRTRFGHANRQRIDRLFRWDRCARETARVYDAVLTAWRGRRA